MIINNESLSELLGSEGSLANTIEGFSPRPQQQAMSEFVGDVLESRTRLVVEAGTGVGKTYAYLVPALLHGGKSIISTGTRHLQDQLFHRDLPLVVKSLSLNIKAALLKGRANYLCLQRLAQFEVSKQSASLLMQYNSIKEWARFTQSGDIVELDELSEDSEIWPKVTSTADNCLGSECPKYNDCYVLKARRKAQEADVVVVNHHLFFADMSLKEEGFGEVLPSANAFILDEAHQLPEVATRFFGQTVSSRQLQELIQDTVAAFLQEAADMKVLRERTSALENQLKRFRLALGERERRDSWSLEKAGQTLQNAFHQLSESLESLYEILCEAAQRGEALENCCKRCEVFMHRLERFTQDLSDEIKWLETYRTSFLLHISPLDVGEIFLNYMNSYDAAWVFTSATLSVDGRFDHFTLRMGLADAQTQQLDSPYDYQKNTLLYLPLNMPEPNSEGYTAAMIDASLPVLKASLGRAFILFTSHRALRLAAERLQSGELSYPIFIQGEAPRSQLLDQFRLSGNGILLGTSSFWEGVDIKGEALSCVIIDKLPFAVPDDPVMQARLASIREQGGNPFMQYQVPQAAIALKQGIGRLIRGSNDRGILMICDPRLKSKPYGRVFLKSLPQMPITHELEAVESFFRQCAEVG